MRTWSIAVIGIGKIAQDQHLPVIARNDRFRLAALVSRSGAARDGVPTFATAAEAYAALPALDAVALCMPPSARRAEALAALCAGKHVLMEKPPTPTVGELDDIIAAAGRAGRVLFTTWHSQYNGAVEEARRRLAGQKLKSFSIVWKEDVRRWHPGQEWIWQPGGFGVFDPGINALSVLTRILPGEVFVTGAELLTPSNRDTPIAASVTFAAPDLAASPQARFTAEFDWRQQGDQTWTITLETEAGETLALIDGGSKLDVDGVRLVEAELQEYERIYERFAALLDSGKSLIDTAPFTLVADAFLLGRRRDTAPFHWQQE